MTSPLSRSRGKWIRRRRRRRRVRGREGICLVYGEIAFVTISLRSRANIFALSLENRTEERVNRWERERIRKKSTGFKNMPEANSKVHIHEKNLLVCCSGLDFLLTLIAPIAQRSIGPSKTCSASKLWYSNHRISKSTPRINSHHDRERAGCGCRRRRRRSGNAQTLSLLRHLASSVLTFSLSLSLSLQSEKQ